MSSVIEEKLVIRPPRSRKKRALVIFLILCLFVVSVLVSLFSGYIYGAGAQDRTANDLRELKSEQTFLRAKFEEEQALLQGKYDDLLVTEAKLTQSQNIQQSAYTELEKNYELVEQRNEFLNRRVNFYRSILSPEDGLSGVRIHDVSLREEQDKLYFEIVLIQAVNHEKNATAKVYVELFESKGDRSPVDNWKVNKHDYEFKFSETVNGSMSLGEDSKVNFLKVIVLPGGDTSKRIVEWHKV